MFKGKSYAIQIENINLSTSDCYTGNSFYINLGSVEMAVENNQTIPVGSSGTVNTTASVQVLPSYPVVCNNTGSPTYRLFFYTFLQDTLFRSPEQELKGFKLGSIIIGVGGSALSLADSLQFSFQVIKVIEPVHAQMCVRKLF